MSDYICPYTCSYRTNSGYCGLTGGAENCKMRKFLGYNSETRQFIVEPVAAGNIVVQSFQTRADKLRSMTDEELAWELARICRMPFYKDDSEIDTYEVDCWAKWLKQEAKT